VRVLITGITGFAGGHLASLLLAEGHEVHGLVRPGREAAAPPGTTPHPADLLDPAAVGALLDEVQPGRVFHLAGAASVGRSFADPLGAWRDNLQGTLSVLEALRAKPDPPRTVVSLSGEAYGRVPLDALPVTGDTPMHPLSPYGASKAAADIACEQYRAAWGVPVIRARAFNQLGPGQDDRFVLPTIARQIAEAEARGDDRARLELGNLETRRDFTDVRDVVSAYRLLAEHGDPDHPYLVASGASRPIRDLVDGLAALARIPVEVHSAPERRREGEQPDLYASAIRLAADTGWAPEIPLEASLRDTLDWWRARAA
jgi:GDP-4-dehydro-6-deoxy-D-mannose reductase